MRPINYQGKEMGTRELPDSAHWCTETWSHHPLLTLMRISVYKTPVWWGESSRANCPLIRALEQSARGTQHRQLRFLPALLLVCSTHRAVTDRAWAVEWLGKTRGESPSTERQESRDILFSLPAVRATEKMQPEGAITKKKQCKRYNYNVSCTRRIWHFPRKQKKFS